MPIIATAGHVDHGKSTLVLALTGRDPDRWAEEKQRGLTIDLGFAWTTLGDHEVGLVDVPGHERFIKNMLAGVGAVDVALFVVAADEGWMPQSEEHLGVLDALGVETGVIALTRRDLVDADLLELAIAETEEKVAGSKLEGWPVVAVAAPRGEGIDELRSALIAALDRAGDPPDIGRPRLWIDRAFTIEGAGLVVTGTLMDGALRTDVSVEIWPGPVSARIRSIQTHETTVDVVGPGTRVAVNITGVDRTEIARGAMLAASGTFRDTQRVHAVLRPVRDIEEAVANRGAYHLHAGSGHWPASLQLIGEPDGHPHAIVRLAEPVPLRMGDRFILREVGRRAVVAGGVVIDPHPRRGAPSVATTQGLTAAGRTGAVDLPSRDAMAQALLTHRAIDLRDNIDKDTAGGAASDAIDLGASLAVPDWVTTAQQRLRAAVGAFHEQHPMRPGIPKATLASQLGHEAAMIDRLVVSPDSGVEEAGPVVRVVGHTVERSETQKAAWEAAREELAQAGFAVPRASSLPLDAELFHALVREGELVLVGDDLAYLPGQIGAITAKLGDLGDGFTVAEFRDALQVSRRQAVPLLEWLDKNGWTQRRGDLRVLRTHQT